MSYEFLTLVVLILCYYGIISKIARSKKIMFIFLLQFHFSFQDKVFQLFFIYIFSLFSNTVLIGGDDSPRVTPVPIPNTEVKPLDADGTAGEAQWESRLSPPFFIFSASERSILKPLLFVFVAYTEYAPQTNCGGSNLSSLSHWRK